MLFWHSCWSRLVKMLFWHSCWSRLVKMLFWHSCLGRLFKMIFWHSSWLQKQIMAGIYQILKAESHKNDASIVFLYAFQWNTGISKGNRNRYFHSGGRPLKKIRFFYHSLFIKIDFFKNSRLTCTFLSKKRWNVGFLSEITPMTLTRRRRTADVTFCADVTLFLHATSGRLPLMIAAMIVCSPTFCVLIVWNGIWTHFLGLNCVLYYTH